MARTRFGIGDSVPARAPNPYARLFFLQAVTRCVPESVQSLMAIDVSNDVALRDWGTRWGFTDAWTLRVARRHAAFWQDQPTYRGQWQIVTVASWEPVFPPGPSWNPIVETKESFRARVEAYIATMEVAPGIQPTPTTDQPDARHFEWTAHYHVGGRSLGWIVEQYQDSKGLTTGAVSEAVKRISALVGITRQRRQGRPKKT